MRFFLPALCVAAASGWNARTASAPHRIQALVITAQDKHPRRETMRYLLDYSGEKPDLPAWKSAPAAPR